jgi:peroxiredoxin
LAEFGARAGEFEGLGYKLAALSVDAPARSARLRERLQLPFPLLSDSERNLVRAWDVFNSAEHGGIAHPATAAVARDGRLIWFEREAMARRARPGDLLAFLDGGGEPRARGVRPRLRDFARALRGVR